MGSNSNPLARQAASFGSVDFLKFLDPGPNGEPLTFAEVLANDPDWAERNAEPGVAQANFLAPAQALDASRNPGGGAEPLPAVSQALLDDVMRLPGPIADAINAPLPPPAEILKNVPPLGNTSSTGRISGGFSQICRHPSFSAQISKDPSFGSAFFQSLLSQKSEDQAMLWAMLGVDPITGNPLPSLPSTSSGENQGQDFPAGNPPGEFEQIGGSGNATDLASQIPNQLPDFGNGTAQIQNSSFQKGIGPVQNQFPPISPQAQNLMQRNEGEFWEGRFGQTQPAPDLLSNERNLGLQSPNMDMALLRPLPVLPGQEMGILSPSGFNLNENPNGARPMDLEATRAGSLNYMLQTSPSDSRQGGNLMPAGFSPRGSGDRGLGLNPPLGSPNLTFPSVNLPPSDSLGFKPAPRRPGAVISGNASLPRPFPSRGSFPLKNSGVKAELDGVGSLGPQLTNPNPLPRANIGPIGSLTNLPPLNLPPTWSNVPAIDGQKDSLTARTADLSVSDQGKTKFVSGLLNSISPQPQISSGLPPTPSFSQAPPTQLNPKIQLPYVKPLPPLPKVPSIEEYHRSLVPTAVNPKLGILPLQGIAPQGGKLNWAGPSTSAPEMPKSSTPIPDYAIPNLAPLDIVSKPSTNLEAPLGMPDLPRPAAVMPSIAVPQMPRLSNSVESMRAARKRQRMDATKMQEPIGHHGGAMDSDDEAEGKRELRKAKNRASAAASRARREAYTASLEVKVHQLKGMQDWLRQTLATKSQGNGQARRPTLSRQKSI